MSETAISVTQAARNFSDCVNRVRYQGASFVLHKNGVPVARIVPVESPLGVQLEELAIALRGSRTEVPQGEKQVREVLPGSEKPEGVLQPSKLSKRSALNW
ncbi:MAG TPA: type II toxin-antitoxin system prevent-host-death family antitoxin [Terracidiphilus sp.]|jgi:prevent-host-death family protein|nr:type II toxin-antitoxin system prevent-host-death family antitoxin [Terracidiphilus sp.]